MLVAEISIGLDLLRLGVYQPHFIHAHVSTKITTDSSSVILCSIFPAHTPFTPLVSGISSTLSHLLPHKRLTTPLERTRVELFLPGSNFLAQNTPYKISYCIALPVLFSSSPAYANFERLRILAPKK